MLSLCRPLRPRDVLTLAVLYALAFLLTGLLHEWAHALAGLAVGRHPVVHATSVDYLPPGASDGQRLVSTAAGPLFSLAQGLALAAWLPRLPTRRPAPTFFVMWMAFHGLTNFTGYLISTPVAPDADLGNIARLLHLPLVARVALAIAGFFGMRASARVLLPPLLAHAPDGLDLSDVAVRNRYLVRAAVFPWLLGVLLSLPATWPPAHWLLVVYTVAAGAGSTFVTEFSRPLTGLPARRGPFLDRLPVEAVAALVALYAVLEAVFRRGVRL